MTSKAKQSKVANKKHGWDRGMSDLVGVEWGPQQMPDVCRTRGKENAATGRILQFTRKGTSQEQQVAMNRDSNRFWQWILLVMTSGL